MSSSSSDDSSEVESWVEWFLLQDGNEFFCEIDRSYIEDNFNLYGLRSIIPNFRACLNVILDVSDSTHLDSDQDLDACVMDLYGLIHARYIITKRGMDRMLRKYRVGEFGACPVVACEGQPVLPIGIKDALHVEGNEAKVYCAKCGSVFEPAQKQMNWREKFLDGAYFGSTFPHLLLMQYPALVPPGVIKAPRFVPRIFGYKIHQSAACRRRITDEDEPKRVDDETASAAELHEDNKRLRQRVAELERLMALRESEGGSMRTVDDAKRS